MRLLVPSGVLALVLALAATTANAAGFKGGSFGPSFGGSFRSGPSVGIGSMYHGSPSYYHNYGYYNYGYNRHYYPNWWYGRYYGYYPSYYGDAYVAERPIVVNPLPTEVFSGQPIRIVNPPTSRTALNYTLNGIPYVIQPGESQDLTEDRAWVISFNRGESFGPAEYRLRPGVYSFGFTEHGWELYAGLIGQTAAPTNPAPAATNPAPTPAPPAPAASAIPGPTP